MNGSILARVVPGGRRLGGPCGRPRRAGTPTAGAALHPDSRLTKLAESGKKLPSMPRWIERRHETTTETDRTDPDREHCDRSRGSAWAVVIIIIISLRYSYNNQNFYVWYFIILLIYSGSTVFDLVNVASTWTACSETAPRSSSTSEPLAPMNTTVRGEQNFALVEAVSWLRLT